MKTRRASALYLAADIGGTNARFALAEGSGESGFALSHVQRFRNEDFEDLRDAAMAFLESCGGVRPQRACFAIAAPIAPGKMRLTNATWKLDPGSLAGELGLNGLIAVNDFAAQARGAPLCPPDHVAVLNEGEAVPDAPVAVLGPGTGLGLGLLAPRPGGYGVIATEGGHAGFAPRTAEEVAVGDYIAREHGFVSWERILSGRGLVNIHRALCAIEGRVWPGARPEEITAGALADPASLEGRVVMLFCACLGAYAGDVSVITGARGGTWLAGGILPRIRPLLEASAFEARRVRRGPMTRYVEAIPVRLILSDEAALLGAAALAETGGL
ncbi:glucokinase [Alkalicaulis satelles]|uniref:Glucokinase n=1 Tax=Alkalicaulis satelles TaxID=2609175 RepID=A0A5M6ZGL2_9PROT|nr:glucokinase [Alkalicaulis satelles]KAA5802268.1 glucokinase [Alkalicaulis satelles]